MPQPLSDDAVTATPLPASAAPVTSAQFAEPYGQHLVDLALEMKSLLVSAVILAAAGGVAPQAEAEIKSEQMGINMPTTEE